MRLLCMFPSSGDATSLYRGVGPLATLKRQRKDLHLELDMANMWRWDSMRSADACFLQRPGGDQHVQMVSLAIANYKPIWIDYDDDLFCVPESNPTHKLYSDPKIQNNMSEMIAKADVISVSTPYLADKIRQILERVKDGFKSGGISSHTNMDPGKVIVIPNAYDTDLMLPFDYKLPERRKVVVWRGSATHNDDLQMYAQAIGSAMAKHLDWCFTFVGEPSPRVMWELEKIPGVKLGTQLVHVPTMDPVNYFQFLLKVQPHLVMVPLVDGIFNRSKSNIGWIEATHAGACCLAPDWEEWQRPGVINYSNPATFARELDRYCAGKYDSKSRWKASQIFIQDQLTLPYVNTMRETLMKRLIAC